MLPQDQFHLKPNFVTVKETAIDSSETFDLNRVGRVLFEQSGSPYKIKVYSNTTSEYFSLNFATKEQASIVYNKLRELLGSTEL